MRTMLVSRAGSYRPNGPRLCGGRRLAAAGALVLLALAAASPAFATLKSEGAAAPLGLGPMEGSFEPLDQTMALLPPNSRPDAALPLAPPSETLIEAVTIDLPVWPWSPPLETGADDPAHGYNLWTYGFALMLIVLGLTLGRRAAAPKPPPGPRLRRPGTVD